MTKYLDKIKKINAIKYVQVCKDLKIDRSNLSREKSTPEKEKMVYEELVKRINNVINE